MTGPDPSTSFEGIIEEAEPGVWRASYLVDDAFDVVEHSMRTFASEAQAEAWLWSIAGSLGFNTIMLSRLPRRPSIRRA